MRESIYTCRLMLPSGASTDEDRWLIWKLCFVAVFQQGACNVSFDGIRAGLSLAVNDRRTFALLQERLVPKSKNRHPALFHLAPAKPGQDFMPPGCLCSIRRNVWGCTRTNAHKSFFCQI
jgi:hypothetical protein